MIEIDPKVAPHLRMMVAEAFTRRLKAHGFDCKLIPNPSDLNIDPHTYLEMFPHKMKFLCVMNGRSYRLTDIVSINQTTEDLAWTICATLPSIICHIKQIKLR